MHPLPAQPDHAQPAPHPFLRTLIASYFDLPAALATLTPEDVLALACHPTLTSAIDSLLDLTRKALALRAIHARHASIATLTALLPEAEDPIERRRIAVALARAAAPIPAPRRPRDSDRPQSAPTTTEPPLATPRLTPSPDHSPQSVRDAVFHAIAKPDDPEPAAGLATLAALLDDNATINNTPVQPDNPAALRAALAAHNLDTLHTIPRAWPLQELTINGSDHDSRTATAAWLTPPRGRLTITLTNRPDSPHPNAWLLANLSLSPNTS